MESKTVYKGSLINLRVDKIVIGGKERIREIVEHRGSVAVLPIIDNYFLLERQYRYAIDKVLLEIPAGTLEEGEDIKDCAKRELLEETGYKANKITYLTTLYLTPGYCTEVMHFFLAEELVLEEKKLDDDELIETELVEIDKAIDMVINGKIEDIKTAYAILWYALIKQRYFNKPS